MTELTNATMPSDHDQVIDHHSDNNFHANDNRYRYPDGDLVDSHEKSFADMIERLFRRFEDRLPLTTIVRVVRESREQLRGSPAGAMPELTERLAAERLTTLSASGLHPVLDAIVPAEEPKPSGTSGPGSTVVGYGGPAAVPALPKQV